MKRRIKYIVLGISILFTIFYTSYLATTIQKLSSEKKQESLANEIENKKVLENGSLISLYKGDILEKQEKLKNIKKDFNLSDQLTKEDLNSALETFGYSLQQNSGNEYVYKREINDSVEPNKYYIREYEGCLAIFKSDNSGKLTIEDQENDIYKDSIKFDDLPEGDKELIKNMQLVYDTKEDAKLDMTDLIS